MLFRGGGGGGGGGGEGWLIEIEEALIENEGFQSNICYREQNKAICESMIHVLCSEHSFPINSPKEEVASFKEGLKPFCNLIIKF